MGTFQFYNRNKIRQQHVFLTFYNRYEEAAWLLCYQYRNPYSNSRASQRHGFYIACGLRGKGRIRDYSFPYFCRVSDYGVCELTAGCRAHVPPVLLSDADVGFECPVLCYYDHDTQSLSPRRGHSCPEVAQTRGFFPEF